MAPRLVLSACSCAVLAAAGCGSSSDDRPLVAAAEPTGAAAQTAAPTVAQVLAVTPDSKAGRTRIGVVLPDRLAQLDLPADAGDVARSVLGEDAGTGDVELTLGEDGAVKRWSARELQAASTPRSVTADGPIADVFACVGDTAAATVVGPQVFGRRHVAAAGVREDAEHAGEAVLTLCLVPRLARDLHRAVEELEARYGDLRWKDGSKPVIGEEEHGEQEYVRAFLPAADLSAKQLLELLRGGEGFRATFEASRFVEP